MTKENHTQSQVGRKISVRQNSGVSRKYISILSGLNEEDKNRTRDNNKK